MTRPSNRGKRGGARWPRLSLIALYEPRWRGRGYRPYLVEIVDFSIMPGSVIFRYMSKSFKPPFNATHAANLRPLTWAAREMLKAVKRG